MTALQFLLDYYNAPEFEDSRDETTQSWDSIASAMEAYKAHCSKELNWDFARLWEVNANEKKEIHNEPKWRWDCGFKLDFDGSLLSISSRFYPSHKNTGDFWEGTVQVYFLDDEILRKEFKKDTLDELKVEVEKFSKHYAGAIKARLS